MNKPKLKELFKITDKPIAIIGAAPSAKDDLLHIPNDCEYFAVNFHFLHQGMFDFKYLAFLDSPERGGCSPIKQNMYRRFKGIKFSSRSNWSDYDCTDPKPLNINDSGIFATWIALYLTTNKVYLCGVNNRKPGMTMYHEKSWLYTSEIVPNRHVSWRNWHTLLEETQENKRIIFPDKSF